MLLLQFVQSKQLPLPQQLSTTHQKNLRYTKNKLTAQQASSITFAFFFSQKTKQKLPCPSAVGSTTAVVVVAAAAATATGEER